MTDKEKHQPPFFAQRRWFPKKEWMLTKKQKVFGFCTSNGKILNFLVPKPWSTEQWAVAVKKKLVPFLQKAFPNRRTFTILLDGERLLHGPAAKAAMTAAGISTLPNWPHHSPDLNPQEHVWAWAEPRLREMETTSDTFEVFQKRCLKACNQYPAADKLVASMAKRMDMVLEKKGNMTGH